MTRSPGSRTLDVRAPTSSTLAGSDAVHQDPDYSGAYVFLATDGAPRGRRHDVHDRAGATTCAARPIEQLRPVVVGRDARRARRRRRRRSGARLTNDGQLRWLGPEKGVIHLATAALVNAVWDLWAKAAGKPLWRLVADLTPEQFVASRRLPLPHRRARPRRGARPCCARWRRQAPRAIAELGATATPRTSRRPGWLGYAEDEGARPVPRGRSPTGGAASRRRSASTSPTTSAAAR